MDHKVNMHQLWDSGEDKIQGQSRGVGLGLKPQMVGHKHKSSSFFLSFLIFHDNFVLW